MCLLPDYSLELKMVDTFFHVHARLSSKKCLVTLYNMSSNYQDKSQTRNSQYTSNEVLNKAPFSPYIFQKIQHCSKVDLMRILVDSW